jgi:RNA polymerase sigma-70 factor (ECF subfamily)
MPEPFSESSPLIPDESLARLVQRGDTEAFGTLVERYQDKLLRYGRKFLSDQEDIQDLVQNTFIRAYQNIRSFDTSQRFSPWMYRIAHNAFVNGLRKNQRSKISFVNFDTFVPLPVDERTAATDFEKEEIRVMTNKGLNEIPIKYKEILILYYEEEMSYKDIAEVLQVPTGTVGIRLKRAKSALKTVYEKMHLNP